MNKTLIITPILLFQGCATSMSPNQFIDSFPSSTTSHYMKIAVSKNRVAEGECSVLVENRKYVAPIGLTVEGDVDNGAQGVDEWVSADGGNSYTLNNFEWVSVGDQGTTQLIVYFDTMLCK